MRAYRSLLAAFCLAALAMAACSFHPKGWTLVPEERFISETAQQAQAQFALGRFKRALQIYSTAFDKHHHPGLRRGYARLGEQIRSAADMAYQRGRIAEAGIDYSVLFESGITTRNFAGTLSFDDDYLNSQIKACSKALMESGLIQYRAEKLDEAIAIWKKALVFDPDNRNIKNAFETATAQRQKLQQIQ
jgi:tetratricopeptide (TPR) repeat protein